MQNMLFNIGNDSEKVLLDGTLPYSRTCPFSPGEMIMSPVNDPNAFFFVKKGTVEVSYTDRNETRITVALIGAGEFFGEIGFFDGESRVRNIQANDDVQVGIFDAQTMQVMRDENPALYMDFLFYITQKICRKFRRVSGEREPVISYAESLSTKRLSTYSETKPLPPSLLNSEGWHSINSNIERYKAELFDLSHKMQKNESAGITDEKIEQRCIDLLGELNGALPAYRAAMTGSRYEEVMWGYIFKELFPYLMRSRFAERAYFKPKGYAGDFLMMEHIYANIPKGDGRLGEIIDKFCLQRPGSLAIHGRRKLLKEQLLQKSGEIAGRGKVTRIMNLACGPNRELFDFLEECDHSELIEALCMDIDSEALRYTNQHVNIFPHRASIRLMSENVIKWSLGRVSHQIGKMDIIYSAGLCDYLDVKLFRALITQCYNHLNPGGTLLLGNFTPYPDSLFLDKLLKWELIYRTQEELKEIFEPTPFGPNIKIISEEAKVNLFAVAIKE